MPLLVHLAGQAPAGARGAAFDTGLAIDAVQWNRDHGLGDAGAWRYQPPE